MIRAGLALLILLGSATAAAAVDIRTAVPDVLYAEPPAGGLYELVAPAIGVSTGRGEAVTVTDLRLELSAGDGPARLVSRIGPERLVRDTRELAELPIPALVEAMLLAPEGVGGFFGAPVTLSADDKLDSGEALVTTRHPLVSDFRPERLTVVATVRGADGRTSETRRDLPVRPHRSAVAYASPLAGAWLFSPFRGLSNHHRFLPSTEFAVDAFAVRDGRIADGPADDPRSWFGYGAEVLAAADGVVEAVISDVPSDRARRADQQRTDPDAFFAAYVDGLRADPARAAAGNLVVIRHATDAAAEYSIYGHLMEGSVRVRPGQAVVAGQPIARVGDTGEFIEPHLHFQVSAGPDPVRSRSLPFAFRDVETAPGPDGDLGRLVRKVPKP